MNSDSKEIEELSQGWVRCRSKSNPGRQYYFNRKTGKSSWTCPQPNEKLDTKAKKKEPPKQSQEKKVEGARSKSVKRKSGGGEAGSSKKKQKNETPDKKKICPKHAETRIKLSSKIKSPHKSISFTETPAKRISLNDSKHTNNPAENKGSPSKSTPTKNGANKRLSQLRAQLNDEAKNDIDHESSPKKAKACLKLDTNETPTRFREEKSIPNVNETTTTKSVSSDGLHSIQSPSQFFAANKIISSMKAQLSEEYCNIKKTKNTFADIELEISSQTTDYPVTKHPSTPPQFSEASKLVSAIKSKLSYSPKDVKIFSSAKDRMEALRASISGDVDEQDLQDDSKNDSEIFQDPNSYMADVSQSSQNCEAMEVEDIREPNEAPKPSLPPKDRDPGQVVLVVDTNIFIHELDFIKNVLNSHIKGYSEQPMLLVPWRVINELDRLKDNNNGSGALCKRARAAMDYLYKSLPENNRIKGQSLRDANSHIYPCESPDDEILNCALQQADRGRNVLLLSNDRNLCNKASVNGIQRVGISELRALLQHQHQHQQPQQRDPDLLARLQHYRDTIYQLLANILENEMRAKYSNLWLHVLLKAPPWQLADVLQCLLKHWIAVFSEVFPRIEYLIADLKSTHDRIEAKDPAALTEAEVASFQELCAEVARRCQIIPEYMELAKLSAARLARAARDTRSPRPARASGTHDERAGRTAVGALEALWAVLSSYCAKLATALGVPHNVEDTIPVSETFSNLTDRFAEFNGCVVNFVLTVEGVLSTEDPSPVDERIGRLGAALAECLQLTGQHLQVAGDDLRDFCLTNRNMLQEVVNKFSDLARLLDACRSKLRPQPVH